MCQCTGHITKSLQKEYCHGNLFSYSLISPACFCSLPSSGNSEDRTESSIFFLLLTSIHTHTLISFSLRFYLTSVILYLLHTQLWPNGNSYVHNVPNRLPILHSFFCISPCAFKDYKEAQVYHVAWSSWHTRFLSCFYLNMLYKPAHLNLNSRKSPEGLTKHPPSAAAFNSEQTKGNSVYFHSKKLGIEAGLDCLCRLLTVKDNQPWEKQSL